MPLHPVMSALASGNARRKEEGWVVYPASRQARASTVDQLVFALKNEGIHLLTLKAVFERLDKRILEEAARSKPASAYLRSICFLYEWMMPGGLDVEPTASGGYVEAIDPKLQYGCAKPGNSTRFRIRDNLPGTPLFCPLVSRTRRLDAALAKRFDTIARDMVTGAPAHLLARAAAFLLLRDSKASFDIEGERGTQDRVARWSTVIGRAGDIPLNTTSLVDLQRTLIGDDRFVHIGLRQDGGFVGSHDRFGQPVPEHISAKHDDLPDLVRGLESFNALSAQRGYDAVLAAACVAFGFVYMHPFEDGNGRLHRFLMHHVLAERGYTPTGLIFQISSVILDDIIRYRDVLRSISGPLLDWIAWTPTATGNVMVSGDTAGYYRYFDATAHCEYLFDCVERAVTRDMPDELAFLEARDGFHQAVTEIVDMGERKLDLLLRFLRQNHGVFSQRAREKEFSALSASEALQIENAYAGLFSYSDHP